MQMKRLVLQPSPAALWISVAALLGVALVVAGAAVRRALGLSSGALCPGLRIGGERVPSGGDLRAYLEARARTIGARRVTVAVDGIAGATEPHDLAELGVRVEIEPLLLAARAVGHEGSIVERIRDGLRARAGLIDLPLVVSIDGERLLDALAPLKEGADEPPIPAKIDFSTDQATAERPGRYVDLDAATAALRAAASSAVVGDEPIVLPRLAVSPRVTRALLEGVDRRRTVSTFSTYFSRAGSQATRARNIETAASKLDGVVLFPHEMVSFNALVGPRSLENGFAKGWEIFKGEMVEGIGGGTCQVASTLYAAAFFAGLEVLERLPHSRPSAYITMGLDATVVYPVIDLKLRNPFDFPLVVHGHVEGNRVTFEVRGREQPAFVKFDREVIKTRPYPRKIEEKPGIPVAKAIRKQHGIRGYTVRRTRTLRFRDGRRTIERNTDVYPPTAEVFVIAPGADADAILPPLPEQIDPLDPTAAQDPQASGAPAGPPPDPNGTCAGSCPESASSSSSEAIIDAPGSHRPTPEQSAAKLKVIMTTQVR